jgi:hypothetical protein
LARQQTARNDDGRFRRTDIRVDVEELDQIVGVIALL